MLIELIAALLRTKPLPAGSSLWLLLAAKITAMELPLVRAFVWNIEQVV